MAQSLNPVFVNFTTLDGGTKVILDGEVQDGARILTLLGQPEGAKQGYGIGYAGLPYAGNISWDGPNIPFGSEYQGIPWGRAVLCSGERGESASEEDPSVKVPTLTLTPVDDMNIHGTCYGTTVKDCSIQLNCAFSVDGAATGATVTQDATHGLFIAVMANASIQGDVVHVGEGETAVAISEAIDPTVLNLETGTNLEFVIPKAVGGYTFTARGTLAKAPFVRKVTDYTSFNDKVTSYPVSEAILAAKVG